MENNNEDNGNEITTPIQDSILLTMKNMEGINSEDDDFDLSLVNHINGAMFTLNQLGVGPKDLFVVNGPEQTWGDFLGSDVEFESVKLYIYLKLRLIFDPPSNAFVLDAIKEQVKEMEYRLNSEAEKGLEVG